MSRHFPTAAAILLSLAALLPHLAAAQADCDDDSLPGLGEICVYDTLPCAPGLFCDHSFRAAPEDVRCKPLPTFGDKCLAGYLARFANTTQCPEGGFCAFGPFCTKYTELGEPCVVARVGLGICRPGQKCIRNVAQGGTICVLDA